MAFSSHLEPKLTIQGETLQTTREYKYLGFKKGLKLDGKLNQKERYLKMECAWKIYLGMISNFSGIDIRKKIVIAKACINTVGLYATEAAGIINKNILETMEKIQRRFARSILGASKCVANETLLLELGTPSITAQIENRTLNFRKKLLNTSCSLMKGIMLLNRINYTNRERRCSRLLAKYNLDDNRLRTMDKSELEQQIKAVDRDLFCKD